MTTKTNTSGDTNSSTDAADNALRREQEAASGEVPVKQHNPGDKGLNPEQKGPAQPSA